MFDLKEIARRGRGGQQGGNLEDDPTRFGFYPHCTRFSRRAQATARGLWWLRQQQQNPEISTLRHTVRSARKQRSGAVTALKNGLTLHKIYSPKFGQAPFDPTGGPPPIEILPLGGYDTGAYNWSFSGKWGAQ